MATSRKNTAEITGATTGFRVGDLLWLADQIDTLPSDTMVRLRYYAGDERDPGTASLSVDLGA
jgi:hypothetical protein